MVGALPRYSLRTIFIATTAAGVLCGTQMLYGWAGVVLCGIAICMTALVRRSRNRFVRIVLIASVTVSLWFLVVHRKYEHLGCDRCHLTMDVDKCELLTIPIVICDRRDPTLITLIAKDLGCECPHDHMEGWVVDDYWGGLICPVPFRGIVGAIADEEWKQWYRNVVRPGVVELHRKNPAITDEFRDRVLQRRDGVYWAYFKFDVLHIPEFNPPDK